MPQDTQLEGDCHRRVDVLAQPQHIMRRNKIEGFDVKNILVAAVLASLLVVEPALAGSTSTPVIEQDVVAQAATADSSVKTDALMLALLYIVFLAAAGGAF